MCAKMVFFGLYVCSGSLNRKPAFLKYALIFNHGGTLNSIMPIGLFDE